MFHISIVWYEFVVYDYGWILEEFKYKGIQVSKTRIL